jgi:putative transposase
MPKDNVIELKKPEPFIEGFLSRHRDLRDNQDRQRVVRNGYLPGREIQTGIGPVAVKVPRALDRQPDHESSPIDSICTI